MSRGSILPALACLTAALSFSLAEAASAQSRRGHYGPSSAHGAHRDHGGGRPRPGRPAGRPDHRPGGHAGGGHHRPSHDIDIDVDHHWDRHWDHHHDHDVWDAVGTAAAVTATVAVTSAIIGSVTHSLPSSSCLARPYGSVTYYTCGDDWYQPRYYGSNVEYVVVERPY